MSISNGLRFLPARYHAEFESLLRKGGWFPGRLVDYPRDERMPVFPEVDRVLREYYGLRFPPAPRGVDHATIGIITDVCADNFDIKEAEKLEMLTARRICFLATDNYGDRYYIANDGLCFHKSDEDGSVSLLRETFEDSLAILLLGISYRGTILSNFSDLVPWWSGRFDNGNEIPPDPIGPWGLLRDSVVKPLTEGEVNREEEALGRRYPADYREFLLRYDGGQPVFNAFTAGPQTKVLRGMGGCAANEGDIRRMLETNRKRFPQPGGVSRFVVIGGFWDGDLLCYDYGPDPDNPTVVMWDDKESTPENPVIIPLASDFSGLLPLFKPFRMVSPREDGWVCNDKLEDYYNEAEDPWNAMDDEEEAVEDPGSGAAEANDAAADRPASGPRR